ncbi:MAG: exopolyphosphatase [Cytophagales bacterium]|nr:exopolyphosphatase [Cytophagales bacterium]
MRKGIIDLGTNTFHLLIVEITGQKYTTLYYEKVAVGLGKGAMKDLTLQNNSINKGLDTLEYFHSILSKHQVTDVKAIGTSILRHAKNAHYFIKQVAQLTNIHIDVIDGKKEAELIYKGVSLGCEVSSENHLIMDIGGGSVEFIICNNSGILWKNSFEVGGHRLMEKFHQQEPISLENIQQLQTYVSIELEELNNALQKYTTQTLIGASGAFDTFYDIYINKHNIISLSRNKVELPMNDFWEITKDIISKNEEERKEIKGMIGLRAKMIVVASILVQHIVEQQKIEKIICTDCALKEGVVAEFIQQV